MEILRDSLIRLLVNGMEYKAGELARYSHKFMRFDPVGGIIARPSTQRYAINTIRSPYVGIYEGQFEIIPGHMKLEPGDEVYISTTNPDYHCRPFKVVKQISINTYLIRYGELETRAKLTELIPLYVENKHSKHLLERGV